MKIAIAGGGWYGCHIASSLKSHGFEVSLLEKNERLFSEASGNNQFRLHQGLHYARSAQTRYQSRDGYHRFVERYPRLSRRVDDNFYLVPRGTSLIDFDTYFSIMLSSGIAIEKLPLTTIDGIEPERFEGAIRCEERVVLTADARAHFSQRLNGTVRLGEAVERVEIRDQSVWVNGERFDHVIDATWGALADLGPDVEVFYEPTLLLYYRLRESAAERFAALTLVDGALWSLYPTETERLYTLSSVTHTPLGRQASKAAAYAQLARTGGDIVAEKRQLMEAEVAPYLPAFTELFEFAGPQFAIKTKPTGLSDNRACGVRFEGRAISVQSGKIDNIFFANERILGRLL